MFGLILNKLISKEKVRKTKMLTHRGKKKENKHRTQSSEVNFPIRGEN